MQDKKLIKKKNYIFDYDVSQYLEYQPKYPDPLKLMELADIFLSFPNNSGQDKEVNLFEILNNLKNIPKINKTNQEWVESKIKSLLCKRCNKNLLIKSEFPHIFCRECLEFGDNQSKCRMCRASIKEREYSTNCSHLCLFCACIHLKIGKSNCPTCEDDLSNLKHKNTSCDSCEEGNEKSFFRDSVFLLRCGHKFCGECLKKCGKRKKCLVDGQDLQKKTTNYIAKYITCPCSKCNQRVYWDKIYKISGSDMMLCKNCLNNIRV